MGVSKIDDLSLVIYLMNIVKRSGKPIKMRKFIQLYKLYKLNNISDGLESPYESINRARTPSYSSLYDSEDSDYTDLYETLNEDSSKNLNTNSNVAEDSPSNTANTSNITNNSNTANTSNAVNTNNANNAVNTSINTTSQNNSTLNNSTANTTTTKTEPVYVLQNNEASPKRERLTDIITKHYKGVSITVTLTNSNVIIGEVISVYNNILVIKGANKLYYVDGKYVVSFY